MTSIRRVAVLGAGTMGSRIAAHLANAGIPSLLLDIVKPGASNRNAAANAGLDAALKGRPAAFFRNEDARLITTGNFDDDLPKIRDCNWIIEAVTEDLSIKRALYSRALEHRSRGAIVSTNTSGIPLRQVAEGYPAEFQQHFLGTHFFNPPRYLHLAEIIPGPDTSPEVLQYISTFCDIHLGKGVVPCKDTPNFIGNRIGSFWGANVPRLTVEMDLTFEEVDLLTGPLIGAPKSATYRLQDIVGLDVWLHVMNALPGALPNDPFRERFKLQPFQHKMVELGLLGDKTGKGAYQRVGKEREIQALDWKTFEYATAAKPRFASLESVRKIEPLEERLKALVALDDKAGTFLWNLIGDQVLYAAWMVPEISDRIVEIDRAMRWGYAMSLGPFEMWDALGFTQTAKRLEADGKQLPENVQRMLSSGADSFYRFATERVHPRREYFDLNNTRYEELEPRPGVTILADVKRAHGTIKTNPGASLIDLGDGVLCCEFHGKMNTIGEDNIQMLHAGLRELENNFDAMVIGNQSENFSVGANLMLVLMAAQEGEWDELNLAIHKFQQLNMALKYSPKPVVAAPFGMSLGGGCEIPMQCARIQASAELYMGLVEVGVGLIPAGGGCKELLIRHRDYTKVFEQVGYAKVSTSAAEARHMRYLRDGDGISMNADRLIADAKTLALSIVPSYSPGAPRTDITVSGEAGYSVMRIGLYVAAEGRYISKHDGVVGEKLAHILSGGRLSGTPQVSEQYLLDLEREAFLSLCGYPETQQRMQHMLKTGKPLRN